MQINTFSCTIVHYSRSVIIEKIQRRCKYYESPYRISINDNGHNLHIITCIQYGDL